MQSDEMTSARFSFPAAPAQKSATGASTSATRREIETPPHGPMRKNRSRSILALLPLIALMAESCGIHGRYDAKGLREDRACLVPEKLTSLEPPLGQYEDQGIRLDYDQLVPRPDPRKGADISYYRESYDDPRSVEQLYYDASQGNLGG